MLTKTPKAALKATTKAAITKATATTTPEANMKQNPLANKAVLTSLTIGGWSARAYDKKVTAETNRRHNANDDAGRYNKLLIAKEAIAEINRVTSAARAAHYSLTQPWYDDGSRVLPTVLYDEYSKTARGFRVEYEAAVKKFAEGYPQMIEDAKSRLNGMFNAEDYPDPSEMSLYKWKVNPTGRFMFDVKIFPCPDSTDFRVDLAQEHADDIRADIEARMKDALEHAMEEPIYRIMTVCGAMVDRLTVYKPAKAGSGKRAEGTFRDSLVDNIRDLVKLLPAFNLTDNKVLTDLTVRMERELCRNDADVLRENADVRNETKKAAKAILAEAEQMMG
jgi:hypothetical protein